MVSRPAPPGAEASMRVAAPAIIDEVPPTALWAEIVALPASQRLVDTGRFQVYWARAGQIRSVLREIGRLRELTFRAVGEGTGRCADIDVFDAHYLHLFVWDTRRHAIAGAYRLGLVEEILARHGPRGLYTRSLFTYGPALLDLLNPAIELGRSFVRAEYQRSFAPLMLLWRGIARFIARSPRYTVLFGPVSISGRYAPESRRLMVDYLSRHRVDAHLASQVSARRPFRDATAPSAPDRDHPTPGKLDELSQRVAQIEPDGKGVPVLLRHYLRLGGRLLGFSVDAEFGNALDGLIMVDVRQIEPTVLERYMGKAGSAAFRAYHAAGAARGTM
jgi:putative hemolysin